MAGQIQQTNMQKIQSSLMGEGAIKIFKDALPDVMGKHAEKAAARLAKMTYTAVCQSPKLQSCTPQSITKAASISASLNLDIDSRGLAYLVPFGKEAVLIIGYQGLMELAYRSGKVKSFTATCIYESEKDKVIVTREDGRITIQHPYSWDKPSGKVIGCYTSVEIEGYGTHQHLLRVDEIEFFRSKSPAKNSPAWKDHYEAMCKKTTVRQHAKWLPKAITKDLQSGIIQEEGQSRTFVESTEVKTQVISEQSGSVTADDVFGQEETKALPAEQEFLQDD